MSHDVETFGAQGLPPARDFVLSGGFAGLAAVVAAILVLGAVLYAQHRSGKRFRSERDQAERHHEERRADALRAAAIERCWDRWWKVVREAALEPAASEGATLGLGPEVTLVLLRGLLAEAEALGDDALTKAVLTYHEQLLLVLAQQSGPLARLATTPIAPADSPPAGEAPASQAAGAATASPIDADADVPTQAERTPARRTRFKPGVRIPGEPAAPPTPATSDAPVAATDENTGRRPRG